MNVKLSAVTYTSMEIISGSFCLLLQSWYLNKVFSVFRSSDGLSEIERNKILCAPKAADDYEDRVKMIITTELAKEKVVLRDC